MEFRAWPKTPRLFKDIVITEKIDGTNACVVIQPASDEAWSGDIKDNVIAVVYLDNKTYLVGAQSRNRMVTPKQDNAGLAQWVDHRACKLVGLLGEGYHYGEWWGSGIQRGYGLVNGEKRFSLFNTHRWADIELSDVPGLGIVPKLYQGPMSEDIIDGSLRELGVFGSKAAPGFMNPEGVIVYHSASRQSYKVTLDNDGHKGTSKAEF